MVGIQNQSDTFDAYDVQPEIRERKQTSVDETIFTSVAEATSTLVSLEKSLCLASLPSFTLKGQQSFAELKYK